MARAERERERENSSSYFLLDINQPTSLLFPFVSLSLVYFCLRFSTLLYTLNFYFPGSSREKETNTHAASVQNVNKRAHARGDVNAAANATRNRIRERDETRVYTKKRSSRSRVGWCKKKRENRIHSFRFYGGDRSNSYILTMVRCCARKHKRIIVFSHTREVSSPSFPFAFYGENAF